MNPAVPFEIEQEARRVIATCGWYPTALADDAWPLSTADVCRILCDNGYACDPDKIFDFAARGISPVPDPWYATDIIGLSQLLEARRDWLPGQHNTKKTAWQIRLEECRASGQSQAVLDDFKRLDLKYALVLMTEAPNQQQREQIYVIIQAILEEQGIVL